MKQVGYIIKIDKPCSQDWSSMTDTDKGRFCAYCSMSVVDFTRFTDKEMINFFEQTPGKICGRLTSQQLSRHISVNQPERHSGFHKLLAGLLVFGATKNAIAINTLSSSLNIVSLAANNNGIEQQFPQKEQPTDSLKIVCRVKLLMLKPKSLYHTHLLQ